MNKYLRYLLYQICLCTIYYLQADTNVQMKLYKFGRVVYVKFEATGVVSNKTHKLNIICPSEFVPIEDIFVSAFQRTAGNNYQSFYGGVVYQIHADGVIMINCENTDYLERHACTSYISMY